MGEGKALLLSVALFFIMGLMMGYWGCG